jgi:hypothetical protein
MKTKETAKSEEALKYNEQKLIEKLDALTASPTSINTTSFWFYLHIEHYRDIVRIWVEQVISTNKLSASKPHKDRKLNFLYLVNDCIQHRSIKSSNETRYLKEFKTVLPAVFEAHYKFIKPEIKERIARLINVWRERSCYDNVFCDLLEKMADIRNPSKRQRSESPNRTNTPTVFKNVIQALEKITKLEKEKLLSVTKINGIKAILYLPDKIKNLDEKEKIKTLVEANGAIGHVGGYIKAIDQEIKQRESVLAELEAFLGVQSALVTKERANKEVMMDKINTLQTVVDILAGTSAASGVAMSPASDLTSTNNSGSSYVNPATLDRLGNLDWPMNEDAF